MTDPHSLDQSVSNPPQDVDKKTIGNLHISIRPSETDPPLKNPVMPQETVFPSLDQAVVGLFSSTLDGNIFFTNTAAAQIFGFDSPEEMVTAVGNIKNQLFVDCSRRDEFVRLIENQEIVEAFLWEGYGKNQKRVWIEEYARPVRDDKGHVTGYEEWIVDVTKRHHQSGWVQMQEKVIETTALETIADLSQENEQLRRELEKSRQAVERSQKELERFHIAARGSQEGFWEGHILPGHPWQDPENPAWYSPQFLELLGFGEEEFPPKLGSWSSLIHPDDRTHVFEALANHINHRAPYDVESRLMTKSGEYRWFKGKGEGIFDEEGNLIRGGGTIRDITDRKWAEQALLKEHTLLKAVIEGTPEIIFVKDHEGKYILINSAGASLCGMPHEAFIGKTDAELFPDGVHDLFTLKDAEVRELMAPQSFEADVVERDVVSRTFLVTKDLFRVPGETKTGIIGFARDITFRKAAELTIREREKRYRAIMDHAYDLIAEVDAEGKVLYASPNFQEILGYDSAALLGCHVFSFVHPDDQDRVLNEFSSAVKTIGTCCSTYRYRHRDGEYHWIECTGRIFDTVLGERRGVVISRDITERKRALDALEALVKGIATPGNRDFFNSLVGQLAEILRVPMVFISERIPEIYPIVRGLAFWNRDHFEKDFEYNCLDGPCESVFEGRSVYIPHGVQEQFPKNSTVSSLKLEAYGGMPLFNSTGEIVGNLAIMSDQPLNLNAQDHSLLQIFAARAGAELERKRAQEALQESQDRYRELYDQTPLMYFTVDANLRVLSVNQFGANLLGYSTHDLVGQDVLTVVDPEDHEYFRQELQKSLKDIDRTRGSEFRKVTKAGTQLWVKERMRTIFGPHQQKIVLLSCEDITIRKHAEEALERSEKQLRHTQKMEAIGTLAGGIAHDFNNILGAILGYSELATAHVPHDQKMKFYLEEILSSAYRAKELVKQILAFSRRSEQEREAVDLSLVVQEVLKMLRATLPASTEIRADLETTSAVVFADSTQLHQVVMNLCANAEYAMRNDGGVIEISVDVTKLTPENAKDFPKLKPGTYVQLRVKDTGKGIPGEVLERIFEPFFTTKGIGEGTGLGLAVVHGIIVGHGGHISVSSEEGRGTQFTVLLPRLDVELPSQAQSALEWPKGSGTVLFVDDEEVLARWGEQVLSYSGYTVIAKTNPHEAVEIFQKNPDQFDAIITDQTMPAMSGEMFARTILNIRGDIPIILCTGFSHTMSEAKATQLGVKRFLMKPVNGALLAETLQAILSEIS